MTTSTYLFAGGGSGGHLMPGLAVAEELRQRDADCDIVFAGSRRPIERTVLGETEFRQTSLPIVSTAMIARQPLAGAVGAAKSLRQALRLIDELQPKAVVGLGGFASVPVAVAAARRRVPLILLEQNVVPGRATTLLSRWASWVCLSFEETAIHLPRGTRTVVTGNPLRRQLLSIRRQQDTSDILVLGGSQGAAGVNAAAVAALTEMQPHLAGRTIVHQTGARDEAAVRAAYQKSGLSAEVAAYFPDLPARYATAALAISRAGATTLAELAWLGCPAVLIPYPRSVRDHQRHNAEQYMRTGAAFMECEGPNLSSRLKTILQELLARPDHLAEMSRKMQSRFIPDAAQAVANLL